MAFGPATFTLVAQLEQSPFTFIFQENGLKAAFL